MTGAPSSAGVLPGLGRRVGRRVRAWDFWARIVYGLCGAVAGFLFLYELGVLGVYRLSYALTILPALLDGFYTSLEIVAVVIPMGFVIGFLVGWARTTKFVLLRGLGGVYVDFFRSMPPIALILFASLIGALELKGSNLNPYAIRNITLWVGALALGFHTAAYQAEIVRAGILSVPSGQTDAADAVGISRTRSMFTVTLPQAFRVSLPALGNEFSSVIKDTSLLSVIGWLELSGAGQAQAAEAVQSYHYLYGALVGWIEVAFLYFILTYLVTRTVRGVEDLFRVPGLEAAR